MIKKIIASDIDGTLMPYGQKELDPRIYPLVEKLLEKDVLFVPASGRNIHSLHKLFEPVKEKLSYLSENGTVVWYEDTDIANTVIVKSLVKDVTDFVYDDPDLEPYLTSEINGYLYCKDKSRVPELKKRFGEHVKSIDSLEEIPDAIVKVTAFCYPDAETHFERLKEKFEDKFDVTMAGLDVVDFCKGSKASGLRILTEYLGLKPEDVIAFGDNYNDVEMLEYAGDSYIMRTEDPDLIKAADHLCDNVIDTIENEIYPNL